MQDYSGLTGTLAMERIAVRTESGFLRQSLTKTLDAVGIRVDYEEQNPSLWFVDAESYTKKEEGEKQILLANPYRDDLTSISDKILSKPVYPHALWRAVLGKLSEASDHCSDSECHGGGEGRFDCGRNERCCGETDCDGAHC